MAESRSDWRLMVDGAVRGNPGDAGCGGLEALLQLGIKNMVVQSDSDLLVRQLNSQYRVKDEKLKVLFQRAMALLRRFHSYRIVHVRREMNKLADRLANRGIDQRIYVSGLKWIKRSRFVRA